MKLDRIRLVNICQHTDTAVEFDYGITGVFGPNGCGKSNLLKMAKVSLTGDFSVNDGVKADNLRYDSGRSPAFVNAVWTHDGTTFEVTRGLQAADTCLEVRGSGTRYSGASEVSAAVERIIGLSKQVIDGFIFVDQWKMFEFMSSKPADRAKTFAHLCNTFAAEKLWCLLGQTAAKIHVQDCAPELAELQVELKGIAGQLATSSSELHTVKAELLTDDMIVQLQNLIDAGRRKAAIKQRILERQADKQEHEEAVLSAATEDIRLQNARTEAEEEVQRLEKQFNRLERGYDDYLKNAKLFEQCEAVKAQKSKLRLPQKPAVAASAAEIPENADERVLQEVLDGLLQKTAALQAEKQSLQNLLVLYETPGIQNCPTCCRELTKTEQALKKQRAALQKCMSSLKTNDTVQLAVAARLKALQKYNTAYAEYKRDEQTLDAKLELLSEQLSDNWTPADDYAAAAQKLQVRLQTAAAALSQGKELAAEAERALAEQRGMLRAVVADISKLKKAYTAITVTSAQAADSKLRLEKGQEDRRTAAILAERCAQLLEQKTALQARIEKLNRQLAKNQRLLSWRSDLERWKQVVHRENLPRLMANALLEQLVKVVNQNLDDFANPFSVSASDDLSFIVHKPNGRREVASRLSGGEKILLAVAFRLAVNSVFVENAGMLVLDEPSAGLDGHNIECLADTVDRIASIAVARRQQIIIVTHDERLNRVIPASIHLPLLMKG